MAARSGNVDLIVESSANPVAETTKSRSNALIESAGGECEISPRAKQMPARLQIANAA
jgi:hypothetical protein